MKKNIILILLAVLAMVTVSILSVSAQDIDVGSMDNEQLTELLMQILNRLQQEEEPAAETDPEKEAPEVPAAATEGAADPEAIDEVIQITIYDNKKLIIESLPAYMFIQPTTPPEPEPKPDQGPQPKQEKQPENKPTNVPEHYNNEPDIDENGVDCHWYFVNGTWLCMYG